MRRHSVSVGYNSTGVLGRRTVLSTQYKTISDGRSGTWSIGVPFYETVAPRSLTTDGTAAKERVLRFQDGILLDSLQHRELRVGLSGGVSLQATPSGYLRLWAGAAWRREDFAAATTVPFPRSSFGTVGAGLEMKRVRFQVLENFNSFARQEDVDLSQTLHLGLWAAPRAWGYEPGRAGVGPEEVTDVDRKGLAAAAPEIVAAVKRMLDGVRDGTLAPAPAEPVAAARTGWL